MAESTTESFACRRMACALAAALLVSSVRSAPGAEDGTARQDSKARRLTAAFLDLDGSPLAGLLEGRLLESASAVWLERNAIEEIQREQQLEGLMAAAATRRRAELGKLLKANLLVLLRHLETPKEHLQLVVCETRHGLRLAVHRKLISPDVEADLKQLSALVDRAIAKHGREIREICAVPPFVSNDLTYENEHLKAAYAKLVEQTIRDRPEFLTVELEEARAIAKEVELSGGQVRRPLPLYFLGEYRHDGKREQRTAVVRIRVMRGQRELATREASGLSPSGAADFVRRTSAELIEQTLGIRPLPPNPKLEAEQLARRADTFHLLGAWDEAATLAEASLLLDRKQMRMHQLAASSLAALARPAAGWELQKDPETIVSGVRRYLRALEHYEAYLPSVSHFAKRSNRLLDRRIRMAVFWPNLLGERAYYPEIRPIAREMRKEELEIYRRIIYSRCKMGALDADWFTWAALRYSPRQEKFDILLEIILMIQDLPQAERLVRELSLRFDNGSTGDPSVLNNPEGRKYLQALAAIGNQHVRRAASQLQNLAQQETLKSQESQVAVARLRPAGPQLLRFDPVEIRFPSAPRSRLLRGWIPAGRGVDLLWYHGNALCLMKQPGQLTRICEARGFIETVAYDGRYAWITTRSGLHTPVLLVIDPQQEQVWEFDEDDGLPIVAQETLPNRGTTQQLWVKALEPGRALLISHFGRMTISTVTFDPNKGAKIQVFFEARVQSDRTDPEPWRNPHMAFRPRYIFAFQRTAGGEKPQRRVLVGARSAYDEDWPLLVDPDAGSVTISTTSVRDAYDSRQDLHTPEGVFRVEGRCLVRRALPDLRPEILLRGPPEGYWAKHGDKFLVFGSKCWQVDPAAAPEDRIQVLAARVPWTFLNLTPLGKRLAGNADLPTEEIKSYRLRMICRSNHFGLLAVRRKIEQVGEGNFRFVGEEVFRIVFDHAKEADPK